MLMANTLFQIVNEKQYEAALQRLRELSTAVDNSTPEGIESQWLTELINTYEEKYCPITYDLADNYFYENY